MATQSRIDTIVNGIIEREGGYIYHADDRGGPTCWGVTEVVAREDGYTGDMKAFPRAWAFSLYKRKYYLTPRFDRVEALSPAIADELADTGVNMGVGRAGQFLQRSLNALNRKRLDYADLIVDGDVGPATLKVLSVYLLKRRSEKGELILLRMLNALQGAKYVDIAEHDEDQESFVFGWFAHRVVI